MLREEHKSKTGWIVLIVLVVLILISVAVVVVGYNKAVGYDESVQEKWAQVENVLVRRFDLIPNLVETVRGAARRGTVQTYSRRPYQILSGPGDSFQGTSCR